MRLLLDTHAFLWWVTDDTRLGREGRRAIQAADLVVVSAASAWEAAIKSGLGKLRMPISFGAAVDSTGFAKLEIDFGHAHRVEDLPPHHGDPFDRMLIAQALEEGFTILTHDRAFEAYRVPLIWT